MVEHAERELGLAGMYDYKVDGDEMLGDYNKMVADAVMELIEIFAKQGHSGFSAGMARELFNELANYKALTPLTDDPDEWNDVSDIGGIDYLMWQNKRDSMNFSKDGGETWVHLDDEDFSEYFEDSHSKSDLNKKKSTEEESMEDSLREYKKDGKAKGWTDWDEKNKIFREDDDYEINYGKGFNMDDLFPKESKKGVEYDRSSTQVDMPKELADKIATWGKQNIPDEEVYHEGSKYGRENEIHCTVLYGLETTDINDVKDVISDNGPVKIELGEIGIFENNPKYDVILIKVKSSDLSKLHHKLDKNLDNNNKYKLYKPHITIAYVKRGSASKYKGDKVFNGKTVNFNELTFSPSEGRVGKVKL